MWHLIVLAQFNLLKFDLAPWPIIQTYMARVATRPAVIESLRAEGLVAAVKICGDALAPAFPPGEYNPDQLPNGAILI